jgi:hypothetical protein
MASVRSRQINGNKVWYQGSRYRLVGAVGKDVIATLDDFTLGPAADGAGLGFDGAGDWTITKVGAGTLTRSNASGGVLTLTTTTTNNDQVNIQRLGESYKLAVGNQLYFGARVKRNLAAVTNAFVGLAITDTEIFGGVTDAIGFKMTAGAVTGVCTKDSTSSTTATLLTAGNATYNVYEFFFESGRVHFLVDGQELANVSTNVPDDEELRTSIQIITVSVASAKILDADYVNVIQIGRN